MVFKKLKAKLIQFLDTILNKISGFFIKIGKKIQETFYNIFPKLKEKHKNPVIINPDSEEFGKFSVQLKRTAKRFIGLTAKEFKVLGSDRMAMFAVFALPVTIIILLGAGIGIPEIVTAESICADRGSAPTEPVLIGLIDYDQTDLSNEFVALMLDYESQGYCTIFHTTNQSELEILLGKGKISTFVVIPPLFEYNLSIHFPAIISLVFDTLDPMKLESAQTMVQSVVNEFKCSKDFMGVFEIKMQEEGVPSGKAKILFIAAPMLFPMILFSLGSLTGSQSVVSDIPKDRMVLTPTNKYEMLAAKTAALQIIMTMLIILTVFLSIAFGLEIRGSILSYMLMLGVLALAGTVWGIFVSSLAKTSLEALQYFIFVYLFQIIVLLFLEDPMILNWIPMNAGRQLLTNVTLRGEPIGLNMIYIWYMLVECTILYAIAQFFFNKRKNML